MKPTERVAKGLDNSPYTWSDFSNQIGTLGDVYKSDQLIRSMLAHGSEAYPDLAKLREINNSIGENYLKSQADSLTGIPSRDLGYLVMEKIIADSAKNYLKTGDSGERQSNSALAALFLDLDGFKDVNDLHGHEAGDNVLRTAAYRLERSLRYGDVTGRYGGDEFFALAGFEIEDRNGNDNGGQAPYEEVAYKLGRRVLHKVSIPYNIKDIRDRYTPLEDKAVKIGASVGVIVIRPHQLPGLAELGPLGVESIIKQSDVLMYDVKNSSKADVKVSTYAE